MDKFIFSLGYIFIIVLIIGWRTNVKLLNIKNAQLSDEINDLEIELSEKDNAIYEIMLDLKKTEKTLAETADKLDKAQEEKEILHLDYVGDFKCTAYCVEKYPHICGTGNGITASGQPVQAGVSVAVADLETFPYGTIIYIEGIGIRIVQDTGSFDPSKIDIAVDTHKNALNWSGQGKHKVYIVEVAK